MALERMQRHKQPRLTTDAAMRNVMQGWHDLRWSPEQISHWLRFQHPQILVFHMEFPRLRTRRCRRRVLHQVPDSRHVQHARRR